MATAAERSQRHRDRKRRSAVVVPVEMDLKVKAALVLKGYLGFDNLTPGNPVDKGALAAALQDMLNKWTNDVCDAAEAELSRTAS